jgi:cobalt-zinc-cadmium efflux system membrane fusion protein
MARRSWLRTFIAAAAVLAALAGGAALAAKSRLGGPAWLRSLLGEPRDAGSSAPLCKEHGVPECFCTLCHPELEATLLMCREHGLPEEICTVCHPEAAEKYGMTSLCAAHGLPRSLCARCGAPAPAEAGQDSWCFAHGVPKALCTACDPELAKSIALCPEHGIPLALCAACRPEIGKNFTICKRHELPVGLCPFKPCSELRKDARGAGVAAEAAPGALPVVRLARSDLAGAAGLELEAVEEAEIPRVLTSLGQASYDQTRTAAVRAGVPGRVREVHVREGDKVAAGQVLAVLDSAALAETKAEHLAALAVLDLWTKTAERSRALGADNIVATKIVLEAETELRRAQADVLKTRQRLKSLGLGDAEISSLGSEGEGDRNRLLVLSPLSGTVVQRRVTEGDVVGEGADLFKVVDTSVVWAHLDVHEKDLRDIRRGQAVTFFVPGLGIPGFHGKVAWIDSEVDDRTRTIRVRAEVENERGILRANMFGVGEIELGSPGPSLWVSEDAVQWEGTSFIVFVAEDTGRYAPRRVLVARTLEGKAELAWGDVKAGANVVTKGSFLLKTEIQRGAIGAGCCD